MPTKQKTKRVKETPLLVCYESQDIFSVQNNGDIILRGKKIGNDKELARIFKRNGEIMKKVLENITNHKAKK